MGCLCLSRPGCHFNTGTPPSPPRFWRKLPKDRVNEEGLWGGQGPRLLLHSSSPALPLCLSFLPASESEEQHKDLTLEGKVLCSSRCMTLNKLCHSLQVNEGRTRELTAYYTSEAINLTVQHTHLGYVETFLKVIQELNKHFNKCPRHFHTKANLASRNTEFARENTKLEGNCKCPIVST